jgi:ubiquinone/menaquinone biosynthesis C-methylase UbiE
MLEVARRRLGAAIDLAQACGEALPFGAAAFDVVVSTNVFHFIRHPVAALREMLRVSKPSARVVITDWRDDYLACRACDMFLRAFSRAHFRTYGSKECRELLVEAGSAGADVERYRINWLWGLMTATATKDAAQLRDASEGAARRR